MECASKQDTGSTAQTNHIRS